MNPLKILLSFLAWILILCSAIAQKHDYQWIFGYTWNKSKVDFHDSPPSINLASGPVNLGSTNASICDSAGQLQLYTNGGFLANRFNQLIPGSESFNSGFYTEMYKDNGLENPQGVLILPGKKNNYHIIHETLELPGTLDPSHFLVNKIRWSEVNMDKPEDAIVRLNHDVLIDTLNTGGLTACKHANGRDWWIICSKFNSNTIFSLLVTPDTVVLANQFQISEQLYVGLSQSCFSPDGAYFARYSAERSGVSSKLQLFKFDRCSGVLNEMGKVELNDTARSVGLAFSPNSKYLYACSYNEIYQFDVSENDWMLTIDTVAIYDGFLSPFPTRFFLAQLAPDGKIYITPNNGSRYLHVIEKPNVKGIGCEVRQHSFDLIRQNSFSMPNFPNFRLGRLEGSVCDTLYTSANTLLDDNLVSVFPNPASDYVQINWPEDFQINNLRLLDFAGKELVKINQGINVPFRLNLQHLTSGMYLLLLESEEGKMVYKKVIRR